MLTAPSSGATRGLTRGRRGQAKAADRKGAPERVPYAAMEAAPDVYAVSYLSKAGYTLTVVLDFKTKQMVGVASGGTTWTPVAGRFEVVS